MTDITTINNTDEILRRFGPDPYPDFDLEVDTFWSDACEGMLKYESKWRQRHQTFAWINEKPDWVSATHWDILDISPNPDRPCVRVFRLSLIGGGQIKVTEEFRFFKLDDLDPWLTCSGRRNLRVQAETDEGLRAAGAVIDGPCYEMAADAVVFGGSVPQTVADRVAATLRLIGNRDDFMALLAHSTHCGCCGRALRDEVSKLLGIGPTCAKAMRLPHDIGTANRVLARRRELLGI